MKSVDLLEQIWLSDLREDDLILAECIGLEAFKRLVRQEGGWSIRVPSEERVVYNVRKRLIKEEYNGYNAKELGKKYGVSASTMRRLIADVT